MDFQNQINEAFSKLTEKLMAWIDSAILLLPNFIIAVVAMTVFVFIGIGVRRIVPRLLKKVSDNKAMNKLLGTVASMLVMILGLFLSLSIMNLDKTVTSLLAGVGVVGIALGFAFQSSAANFISGFFMAFKYPVNVGDIIETNGVFGKVEKIGIRYIIMETPQGQKIAIPNRKVLEDVLKNYTISGERRIDLECGISYGDDLEKVKETALNAINQLANINKGKDVDFFYTEFGDSSINFMVRYWIKYTCQPDFLQARSDGVIQLKKVFDQRGITIPFPIRTLDFGAKGGEALSQHLDAEVLADS